MSENELPKPKQFRGEELKVEIDGEELKGLDSPCAYLGTVPTSIHVIRAVEVNGNEILKCKTICEIEKEHILTVIDLCKGNKKAAAKHLGICLKTLYTKLDIYEKRNET